MKNLLIQSFRKFAKKKFIISSSEKITYNDLPEDDPQRRCPDITMAKKMLKWEPSITLSQGLLPTIEWFRRCISG